MIGWWTLIVFAVFLIGVTKSGFGAGVGLMIVPMTVIGMAHLPRGADAALGLMLPLLILGDFIAVWQYRKLFSLQIVKHLLPGTAVGVVLGGLLLWWVHKQPTRLLQSLILTEVGLESILLVSMHWYRQYKGIQTNLMREPMRSALTGGFSAVSSTLAHAAGPIITMYLLPLKLDRRLYVGTTAIYFFILNSAKLPAYYYAGQFKHAEIGFTVKFMPLVVIGALFGLWINRRMSDKAFTRIVYIITFLLGWYVLYLGVEGLVVGY